MLYKIRSFKSLLFTLLLSALLFCLSGSVFAGVVAPSGKKGSTDRWNIQEELARTKSVTLQKGGKYYLDIAIRLKNNYTIDATGATIVLAKAGARNSKYSTDYKSLSHVTIIGGKWISASKSGCPGTTFSFAHANHITMKNMNIQCTNAEGHAIELSACSDVLISNCKVIAKGTFKKNSVEEMIQIDLATPRTAPFLENSKQQNGLACKNITITGCTVTGNRAVCANWAASEPKFQSKYHTNIVIKNCTLTGKSAEGLALFNTINATVTGCKITSNSKRLTESYSCGANVAVFGKVKAFSKGKITFQNNTTKGGRRAFLIYSHADTQYGQLTFKKNKLYCKAGANEAYFFGERAELNTVKKVVSSGNKRYKW